jgi:hypothetical protein
VEKELYGSLHGLRCCGARLYLAEDSRLKLGPGTELAAAQFGELEQYYFQTSWRNLENLLNRLAGRFKPDGG